MPFLDATIRPSPIDPRFALAVPVDESGRTEAMSDIPDIQHQAYKYGVIGSAVKAAGELTQEAHRGYKMGKLQGRLESLSNPVADSMEQIGGLETEIGDLKRQQRLAKSTEELQRIEPALAEKLKQLYKAKEQGHINYRQFELQYKKEIRTAINENPGYTQALTNHASDVLWAAGIREIKDPAIELAQAQAANEKLVLNYRMDQAKKYNINLEARKIHDENYWREEIEPLISYSATHQNKLQAILDGKKIADATKHATSVERNKESVGLLSAGRNTIRDLSKVLHDALTEVKTPAQEATALSDYYTTVEQGLVPLHQHFLDSGHSYEQASSMIEGLRKYARTVEKAYRNVKKGKTTQEEFDAELHFDSAVLTAFDLLGMGKEFRSIAEKVNTAEKDALIKSRPELAKQFIQYDRLKAMLIDPASRSFLVENMREFEDKTAAAHMLATFIKSGNFETFQDVSNVYNQVYKNTSNPMMTREDRVKMRDDYINTSMNLPDNAHKFLSAETKQNYTEMLDDQMDSVMYFVENSKKNYNYNNKFDENGLTLTVVNDNGEVDTQKTKIARDVFGVRINEAISVYSKITGKSMEESARAVIGRYSNALGITLPEQQSQGGSRDMLTSDFLKKKEGFREKAYPDAMGWAVGYGFTKINGVPVKEGDTITREEAEEELVRQTEAHSQFKKKITVNLTPNQEDALGSFEYNLGSGIWNTTAGKRIISLINSGDLNEAAEIMRRHDKSRNPKTGQLEVNPGLVKRREEESKMFTNGE
jgi:lysozyme